MPDQVAVMANRLLDLSPDPVPAYRILRDILVHQMTADELKSARLTVEDTRHVQELFQQQSEDGFWGNRFFTRNKQVKQPSRTMETALIRLNALGLDASSIPIQRAIVCMEDMLAGKRRWPDRLDPALQFENAMELVIAARLREWDPNNSFALAIADKLLTIMRAAFEPGFFDEAVFSDVTEEITGARMSSECSICFSIYPLILLRGLVDYDLETLWIDHLIKKRRGIYLLGNRSIEYLPLSFPSQEGMRFINMLDLLSWYPAASDYLTQAGNWLWSQMNNDGLWDFGRPGRDGLELPLSDNWRSPLKRQIDSSVRALTILNRLQQSCSVRETLCHPI